jgi:protein-tyrosine phosphatase
MVSILFVCLGNICRSPAAEGVLKHFAQRNAGQFQLHVESCGLGDWHLGNLPDQRMREAAKNRGIILTSRAQTFHSSFFDRFDMILAADHKVLNEIYRWSRTPDHKAKVHLITHFSKCYPNVEIPDPYYEGESGFEHVLDMIEDACEGILESLKKSSHGSGESE